MPRASSTEVTYPCDLCVSVGCPIQPSGHVNSPDIAFIGEAPGAEEIKQGVPFVGPSGKLLRATLTELELSMGLPPVTTYFDNAVMWLPPRDPPTPNIKEIRACWPRLKANLLAVQPKVIVALGNSPVAAMLGGGGTGIMRRRGYWHEVDLDGQIFPVMPMLHPAGVIRRPDGWNDMVDDLEKVLRALHGEELVIPPPYENYIWIETQLMFDVMLERMQEAKLVAVDIETTSLRPDQGDILSVAFSWEREQAAVLNWQTMVEGHPDNASRLGEVLARTPLVFHNAQFDVPWLEDRLGHVRLVADTMLLHYGCIDERQGTHRLKRLANQYYKAPEYDADLLSYISSDRGSTANESEEDRKAPLILTGEHWQDDRLRHRIMDYNGADSDYTFRLAQDLRAEAKAEGTKDVHNRILIPAARHFIGLEREGMLVDREYHDRMGRQWQEEVDDLERQMHSFEGADELNFNSPIQLRKYMFDELGLRPMRAKGEIIEQVELLAEIQEIEDDEAWEYWRASSAHSRKLKPTSTSSYMMYWLAQQHPLPRMVIRHRLLRKRLGTYYTGYRKIMRGDRIHPRYRLHGTRTGRLSSTDPNIHAMPRTSEMKKIFIADPGYTLIAPDYSQAEVRMLAELSGDEVLREACESEDIHRLISMLLFRVSETQLDEMHPEQREFMRRAAKTIVFGLIYGLSDKSLAPQLGVTETEARAFREMFLGRFRVASRYIADVRHNVMETRESTSIFHRKRRYPVVLNRRHRGDIERQAVNMPIQSAVSDMTLLVNMRIHKELNRRGIPNLPWPHIHDGFLLQVATDRLQETLQIGSQELRDVGFENRVTFAAEVKVGQSWGDLHKAEIPA